MGTRLFESALTGNIDDFRNLLRENPLIFHTISLYPNQNPLHIASAEGHVEFVREILRLRPDYAREVNKDGFSPLHIAAANGHIQVVKELLNIDPKLCDVKGIDNKTPLHFAAMKGRVDVMNEMISRCAECIESVTVQRDTALHLAIKNSQFEAIKVMVDWIIEMKKEDILNHSDEQGNTALHLATWKKQRRVIELLLDDSGRNTSGLLEINAVNRTGLTAMGVLQMFPSEAGDREIVDILRQAGAVSARDVMTYPIPSHESHDQEPDCPRTPERCRWWSDSLVEYFKFKKGRDSPSEARSGLLVVAVLVATATFQVGLSPPGGTWQDSYFPDSNNGTNHLESHSAGTSIMGTNSGITFALFMTFNSIGFSLSLFMINILTSKFPLHFELQICTVALYFTYNTAITCIAPSSVRVFTIIITSLFSASTPILSHLVKPLLHLFKKRVMDIIH